MTEERLIKINKNNIGLSKEYNLKYFELFTEHNEIMSKFNLLINQINEVKQPKIFLCCNKSKLKSFEKPLKELQKDYLKWLHKVSCFLSDPEITFKNTQDKYIGFSHFICLLIDLKNCLNTNMILIADNLTKKWQTHNNQVNFIIAMLSASVSTIGLAIAIFALIV